VDTSADLSERGCVGARSWVLWLADNRDCVELAGRSLHSVPGAGLQGCTDAGLARLLTGEAVAEHRVSVASNPSYVLEEILQLVWLAQDGKMKGEEIAVVGRERKGSGRSWRWVEMHCCPRFSECDSWKGCI
jgi:hypothetical protein